MNETAGSWELGAGSWERRNKLITSWCLINLKLRGFVKEGRRICWLVGDGECDLM
jgi:hypothetical protein